MGFFLSLVSICLFVSFGVWFGIKFCAHFYQKSFLHHKEFSEGIALYLALLIGMGLFSFKSFIPFTAVLLWGFAGLGILLFSWAQLSTNKRIFFQGLLCIASVLALYPFSENALTSLLLALLWWLMWRVIVWFDRFPLTSILVSFGWTMAILTTGLLLRTIPNTVVAITSLLGTMTFLFSSFNVLQEQPVLGRSVSSLLGFVWAGIWVYFLNQGAFFQTLTAFGYYLFEAGFLMVALFCHKPFQTLLASSLMDSQVASKAAKSVFSHILLLSFFSVVKMPTSYILIALVVILLDLYLRLNNLKNPLPTWRELFKNTHQGMTDFMDQVKQKVSSSRKTVSKKPIKKKKLKRKSKK